MSTASVPVYEWKQVNWKHVQWTVFKLQKRIYRASKRGDNTTVRRLQRLLVAAQAAKLLAVRKVTQDNRGKRTAGTDGVKNLTPSQRVELVNTLTLPTRANPTRRVWIPKKGTTEQRPLGIPTIRDRAAQALLKLALEPEWEARFEPNSFGFRPGRGAHDAIDGIFRGLRESPKYVLDADIAKCFDRIDHTALLQKLNTAPTFRQAIRAWLKAGVMDGPQLFPTEEGTPQGGVISPLLANIALHGMETVGRGTDRYVRGRWPIGTPIVIRYADDFVVLHKDLSAVEAAQQRIATWLQEMNLELKPSKTRIVHSMHEHEGQPPGFDFLGFTVRQFPASVSHAGKDKSGRMRSYKTFIRPSLEARKRHRIVLRERIKTLRNAPQAGVIHVLNPVIRGWANYYRTVASAHVFNSEDRWLHVRLRRWAKRRHPRQTYVWSGRKYWHLGKFGNWTFQTPHGDTLNMHREVHIQRHVKVQGDRSYFDGDWSYWGARLGRHPALTPMEAFLLKQQRGYCTWCKLRFTVEDITELDHIIPTRLGGENNWKNRQLLHGYCHDEKTAKDGSLAARYP